MGATLGSTPILTWLIDAQTYSTLKGIFDGVLAASFYIFSYNVSSKITNLSLASRDRGSIKDQLERAKSALESEDTEEFKEALNSARDMVEMYKDKWGDDIYLRKLENILYGINLGNSIKMELEHILQNLEGGRGNVTNLLDRLSELREILASKVKVSDKTFNKLLNLEVKVIEMLLKKERDSYFSVLGLLDKTEKLASKRSADAVLDKILELKIEAYRIGIKTQAEVILRSLEKGDYCPMDYGTELLREYVDELGKLEFVLINRKNKNVDSKVDCLRYIL